MKKYVLVGTGSRGTLAYLNPITKRYQDCAEICGVYDLDSKRAKNALAKIEADIPVYEDFDVMLNDVKPDEYIILKDIIKKVSMMKN